MNILHLEDNDDDAVLICETLRNEISNIHLTRVDTRKTFLEAMEAREWDMILADYSLPSFDGISALKLAVGKCPDVPFIFVTGSLGEELAVETLRNGATDYILKHRIHRLAQAVVRAMRESESARGKKAAERKLRDSLREKELLLQEVHHRVNNNLQLINSLLDMQAGAATSPLIASALKESQKRVRSVAMVHQMLYASASLEAIDFADYARLLTSEVATSFGIDPVRIRLALSLDPVRLETDRAVPCGLILNELLTNAFKYAFPGDRHGEIRVSLQQQENSIRLAVEDDGVGLPQCRCSPSDRKSLGLEIVKALTRQLGGHLDTSSGDGARFVFTFSR
jgi:two-component sensor histidine kinase/CheY-like chemotaxis protein